MTIQLFVACICKNLNFHKYTHAHTYMCIYIWFMIVFIYCLRYTF